MKRDQVGPPSKGQPELFLSRARRGIVPRWMPVVVAAFACAYVMAPDAAYAFSLAGTGLEQNATTPEQIDLDVPVGLAHGGTHADLSATGGTGPTHYLKQAGAGADITVGAIAAADLPSSIDAAKLADGSVSNAELQHVNGVTSGIQSQIDGKLSLSGGTLTGSVKLDNLGLEGDPSDTNPNCTGSAYYIYADLSENKWKKCQNGVASDLDTDTGGSDTVVEAKMGIRSSVKFSMGASATRYMALNGEICTAEDDCLIPYEAGVFDDLTCLSTATQDANDVTVTLGEGPCDGTIDYDGASLDIPATAITSATATGAKTAATGSCVLLRITTGVGEALANAFVSCSLTVTGPAV